MGKIIPLRGYVLIQTISEEQTASGLYMPEKGQDKPDKGKVLAYGPGKMVFSGGVPLEDLVPVKVGDVVYFHRWSAHDLPEHKGQILIKHEDIQGVEENG